MSLDVQYILTPAFRTTVIYYGHSIDDEVHRCYSNEENLRVIDICIHVCIMYVYISMMDAEKV